MVHQFKLPSDSVIALTILGGGNPCLVCGGPKQHKALVICDACDSIVTDPENKVAWHEYRYKEVRPQWFKSIRATGSIV